MKLIIRKLIKRLGTSLLVLWGVSLLIFFIARVIPGDPARISLGPTASVEQVAKLRKELRLDDPFWDQYKYFLTDLLRGDLGVSLYTNRPVTKDIAQFLPATLELVFFAGLLIVIIGFPLGVISARYSGKLVDHLVRLISLLGVSAPSFVWAVILMLLFSFYIPLFPVASRISENITVPHVTGFLFIDTLLAGDFKAFLTAIWYIILPSFALALAPIGQAARLIRSHMVDTYRQPYIEMARSYGFPERKIAHHYAFKPSMIPALTIVGLDFAAMLGNAFLVEAIFAWPGLSRYGVAVILRKDLNAIVGTVLVISLAFLVSNIITDLLVNFINPRIRYSNRVN